MNKTTNLQKPISRVDTPLDLSQLSKEEIVKELEKGIEDSRCGRTTPAKEFFKEFRKEYGI